MGSNEKKKKIQFLLIKYSVFFLTYASLNCSYQILYSLFLVSFVLNVIVTLFRISEGIKYYLQMRVKDFSLQ